MSFEILALVGPTASGKSKLSLQLAESFQAIGKKIEIVNADAMQLYRGLDIGTAKLSNSEQQGIPHHLIDVVEPSEEMTAVEYKALAREKIIEIISRGHLPVLVGGSMFYISAALDELEFSPTDPVVRNRLEEEQKALGPLAMHERLRKLDPVTAKKIPANNLRRVVRALEVIELTGQKYQSSLPEPRYWRPTLQFGINVPREVLRERVERRTLEMWQKGFLSEVEGLLATGVKFGRTARVAIGYSQAIRQLQGELTQEEAISETISLTMRYARRQMSWFRRDKRIHWLTQGDGLLPAALAELGFTA